MKVEPLFYRGRGITASDAVFTIIWSVFSARKNNVQLYYNDDIDWHCSRLSRSVILEIAALVTHLSTVRGRSQLSTFFLIEHSVLILRSPLPLPKLVLLNVDYFREFSFSVPKGACHVNIPLSMYIKDHHRSTMSHVMGSI